MTASTDVSTTPRIEQVGGDHYASAGLQHWDLCARHDVHYLLGCASKYVARHRRKNGREDLQKAISYLERYGRARSDGETRYGPDRMVPAGLLIDWAAAAQLDVRDLPALHAIMCTCQHHVATEMLRQMIELEYPVNPVYGLTEDVQAAAARLAAIKPGTPEDGGHHERGILLPREITQFWYDHRLDPSMRECYTRNASSCRWELQETPGVTDYDLATEEA